MTLLRHAFLGIPLLGLAELARAPLLRAPPARFDDWYAVATAVRAEKQKATSWWSRRPGPTPPRAAASATT